MTTQEDDLVTLLRMTAGSTRSIGELYDRYGTLVFSVATATLRGADPDVVADVVRDVWRQVSSHTITYDPSYGSVALWLVLVTRDRALERGRTLKTGSEAERLVMGTLGKKDKPAAAFTADIQNTDRARNVLARLTPLERQALAAALFERLTFERISGRLEVTEETVKQWLRQGLTRLGELVPEEVRQ